MNIAYLLYQAERTRGAAEQREVDASAGELAAAIGGWAAPGGVRSPGREAIGLGK